MIRRRLMYSLAVGAALTVLALWLWPSGPIRQTVFLSDGTRLTLHTVGLGTNSTFAFGGPFRRLARRLPVAPLRRWAGDCERRMSFQETNLALWFTSAPLAPRTAQYQFSIADDFGTNTVPFRPSTSLRIPGYDIATCFNASLWPRRSKFFTIQAFADLRPRPEKPEWEFRIRNPAFAEYPQWPPERFPATRTVAETRFTLWEVLPDRTRNREALGLSTQVATEARLRIDHDGQPNDEWSVCGVQFRDATGNRVQVAPADATRTGPGRWWVRVPGHLFAGEEAGKIGVGFVRRTNLPTNDTFVIRNVPVRTAGTTTLPGNSYYTNPIVGRLHVAAERPGRGGGNIGWAYVSSAEAIVSDISSPNSRWFLVLGATDDSGRAVAVNNSELDASRSRQLILPSGALSVDVTVAAPRVVFVEWTASRRQLTPTVK